MTNEEVVAVVRDEMSRLTVPNGVAWRAHVIRRRDGYELELEFWHARATELCYTTMRQPSAHWSERLIRSGVQCIVRDLPETVGLWRSMGLLAGAE